MSYKSTRRQWVKLWVNEWLDGTSRFELTAAQRLLWVDLLALAGRSRFPGYIYAGIGESGKKVGYPMAYLAGVLQMDEIDLNNSLKLLLDKGHITLEESSKDCYIIGIINWEKYQSEYLRQKAYRKVTTKTTSRLPVEVEVDGEVEGEVDNTVAKTATATDRFDEFWACYPKRVGKAPARKAWTRIAGANGLAGEIIEGIARWRQNRQWDDPRFIPNPATFLNQRRWEDEVPADSKMLTDREREYKREASVGAGPEVPQGTRLETSEFTLEELDAEIARSKARRKKQKDAI